MPNLASQISGILGGTPAKQSPEKSQRLYFFSAALILMVAFAALSMEFYFRDALNLQGGLFRLFFSLTGSAFILALFLFFRSFSLQGHVIRTMLHRHREREDFLEKEIRRKEKEAVEFLESCLTLMERGELKQLCERVMEVGQRTLEADQGSIMLLDGRGRLKISASRGLNNEIASKVQLRLGERVAGLAALEKTEYLLNGTLENYPLFKNLEGNPLIRSAMICPICYDKKVLGILNISRTLSHVPFTQEDLTRASLLARQIGAAIHLSQICRTLEDRAREFKTVFAMYQQGRQELEQIEKLSSVMVPMPKDHRLSA